MQERKETQESTLRSRLTLVAMRQTFFRTASGQVVNFEQAQAADFDAYISQFLGITDVDRSVWPLMTRWRAVNFAVKNGQFLPIVVLETEEGTIA